MSLAQYKCPHCGQWTGMMRIYNPGTYKGKCSKCKKKVVITVSGYTLWRPNVAETRKG